MSAEFDFDKFMAGKPLAITQEGLEELRAHIIGRLQVFHSAPREYVQGLIETLAASPSNGVARTRPRAENVTGVIPIRGTISQHAAGDVSAAAAGGTATEDVAQQLRAFLADDSVSRIVLDIDSPGGTSFGVAELAQELYNARGTKPIIAVANSLAASAAYWIGASAQQFFVTPGGLVGSIGVYALHQDVSKAADQAGVKTTLISAGKYKTDGNQWEPLGDEARARIQARVNDVYDQFVRAVAAGRGVPAATVRGGFGQGDVLTAQKAVSAGMVDGVRTFEQVVSGVAPAQGEARLVRMQARLASVDTLADDEGTARWERMKAKMDSSSAASNSLLTKPNAPAPPAVHLVSDDLTSAPGVRQSHRAIAERALRHCRADLGISRHVELNFFIRSRIHPTLLGLADHGRSAIWVLTDVERSEGDIAHTVAHECWHLSNPDEIGDEGERGAEAYATRVFADDLI